MLLAESFTRFRRVIKQSKGRAIQNLIQIPPDDKVRAIIDVKDFGDKDYVNSHNIVLCTKKGIIKKTLLKEFQQAHAKPVLMR